MSKSDTALDQKHAYRALVVLFFIFGATYGGWASRIPDIQAALQASDAEIGVALFVSALGAMSAVFISPVCIRTLSSRKSAIIFALIYISVVPLLGVIHSLNTLFIVLLLSGMTSAIFDVAINTQGVELETTSGKKQLASLHALFSVGVFFGGILASWLSFLSLRDHLFLCSVAYSAFVVGFAPRLLDRRQEELTDKSRQKLGFLADPGMRVLAVVLFVAAISEGAFVEWSARFLRGELSASISVAPLGVSSFSLGMCIGRATGDIFRARYEASTLLFWGSLLALLGSVLFVFAGSIWLALLALFVCGTGLSALVPIAYAEAGKGELPERRLAQLTAVAYAAILLGPAVIGWMTEIGGLRIAFTLIPTLLVLSIRAGRILQESKLRN